MLLRLLLKLTNKNQELTFFFNLLKFSLLTKNCFISVQAINVAVVNNYKFTNYKVLSCIPHLPTTPSNTHTGCSKNIYVITM